MNKGKMLEIFKTCEKARKAANKTGASGVSVNFTDVDGQNVTFTVEGHEHSEYEFRDNCCPEDFEDDM